MSPDLVANGAEPGIRPADIEALGRASTATITSQLFALGLRNTHMYGVRPLNHTGRRMVGEAFTLRYIPAREDIDVLSVYEDPSHPQRLAVESVAAGQVLVMDSRGQGWAASAGNILVARMWHRQAAGLVTDGSLRDSPALARNPLPVYATGPSPQTNLAQHHAVDLQVPIACGGVAVYPGDVIVGDEEGVVCVPRALVPVIAEAAAEQEKLERFILRKIESGSPLPGTYPPSQELLREYKAESE